MHLLAENRGVMNMQFTSIKNDRIHEEYFTATHKSGLKIFIYPKKSFKSTYAIFGTKFGSINASFAFDKSGPIITVPDGTAHFLEHKMFESEDGDAFDFYAKTGASANAYTSFDKTCYLFSCTENFEEALKILVKFVETPYFTKKTVDKEQGIIGQEIKMYEDSAEWKVLINLLKAMYKNHPINIDIAGSVESIANITAEKLYECYKAFYNPANMALCIVGNVDLKKTAELLESILTNTSSHAPMRIFPDEPYEVRQNLIEERFPISCPMFQLGFKENAKDSISAKELVATDIILEVLASKASGLYKSLLDAKLINIASFGVEYFYGEKYAAVIFSGESNDPYKTQDVIKQAIRTLKEHKISSEVFERARKSVYAKNLSLLNSSDNIANSIIGLEFSGKELFDVIECIATITLEEVEKRLEDQLDVNNCSLSVVLPLKE